MGTITHNKSRIKLRLEQSCWWGEADQFRPYLIIEQPDVRRKILRVYKVALVLHLFCITFTIFIMDPSQVDIPPLKDLTMYEQNYVDAVFTRF